MRRSLGPDHSLNTPRCTCRGIIHCLYFPLPPSSHCSSSLIFLRPSPDLVFSPSTIIPRLAFRSRSTFDAFQRCRRPSRPSSLSYSLLLRTIEIQRCIDFLSPLHGINPLCTLRIAFCMYRKRKISLELKKFNG